MPLGRAVEADHLPTSEQRLPQLLDMEVTFVGMLPRLSSQR